MSNTLIKEGLRALSEQTFSYKRNPDGSINRGNAIRTNRKIEEYMKMLSGMGKDVPPSAFNRYALNSLDDNKYPRWDNMPDTADTFSSDEGHVRPFSGMNKDPDYYFKNPPEAQGIFPNLETGVERKQRRFPDAPTMAPLDPVVRGKDYSADNFNLIINNAKQSPFYDI